ncbi:MAG: zinc-ribbon domain-containing protein, partial [Clostridia bacterium]|nr:zinc-ribbon domain-containing protein [Clostridia bacterium]
MKCPQCGKNIAGKVNFCPWCGYKDENGAMQGKGIRG